MDGLIYMVGPLALAFYVVSRSRGGYVKLGLHALAATLICLVSPVIPLLVIGPANARDGFGNGMIIIAFLTWPFAAFFGLFTLLNLVIAAVRRFTSAREAG